MYVSGLRLESDIAMHGWRVLRAVLRIRISEMQEGSEEEALHITIPKHGCERLSIVRFGIREYGESEKLITHLTFF